MSSLPVLVVSCDRYADVWRPFFQLFWRRWPDCPGPVYLGSNDATYDDPRVQPLRIGEDVTWAAGLLSMLDRISGEYVIIMLEDFLLMQTVDNERIQRLSRIAVAEQVGCLRLYSIFPPERPIADYPELASFAPADRYRITLQAAIWRVELLKRLLVPGFTPWDFELVGSQMSDFMPDRIWGVKEPAIVYDHVIEKGKWRPQGLAICREAGIEADVARRGAFTVAELEGHEQAGVASAEFAERKRQAVMRFRKGRRAEALRDVLWCVRRQPASIQLWAIAAAGCVGPSAMASLQRLHVRAKVAAATRAYRRALRARAPQQAARETPGATGTQQG